MVRLSRREREQFGVMACKVIPPAPRCIGCGVRTIDVVSLPEVSHLNPAQLLAPSHIYCRECIKEACEVFNDMDLHRCL